MIKSTLQMIRFEFRQVTRLFPNIFFSVVFPLLLLLVFGSLYGNNPNKIFYGYGSVDILTPSYIGNIIAVNSLNNLPLSISFYREIKVLKRYRATPINPVQLLISQFIVYFILSIVSSIILISISHLTFGLRFEGNIFLFALYFILSSISMSSIGLLISSLTSSSKICIAFSNIVYFPMIFLSGASFATELMPEGMMEISAFVPLTYCVNLLKSAWLGLPLANILYSILILIGITILSIAISTITFKWD
ncbi:MAG: ABC transporter permease [Andreesenia angusta]|nr:ABC transporter permease [Andreesenia angusta]